MKTLEITKHHGSSKGELKYPSTESVRLTPKTFEPLSEDVKSDIEKINLSLLFALDVMDRNIPPSRKLELVRQSLISSLQKLPISNYFEIAKYL
jgi:hypothetical protein